MDTGAHIPVLYNEVLAGLKPRSGGRYIDGTVGLGGHAAGILQAAGPDGQLLGLDRDPQALALAREKLVGFGARVVLVHESFTAMDRLAVERGWGGVDGILLDLGVSSLQMGRSERGFAFQHAGPLDMRFDPAAPLTAAEIVNEWSQDDLASILYRFGEERQSRKIARAIVAARPVRNTRELAEVVASAVGRRRTRIHPATRTFQALRIAVNEELDALAEALPKAIALLAPGGRLAVIAFHSLEDRLVKETFRRESRDCVCPPERPECRCGHKATLRELRRKPQRPTEAEVARNPRSRSARLRVAEKL